MPGRVMNSRSLRMWLRPGMRIKRWIALFMFAIILTSLALAMGAKWFYDNYSFHDRIQGPVDVLTLQFIEHRWREAIILGGGVILLGYAVWRLSHSVISPLL